MDQLDGVVIEIVNWEKFNGRKDIKTTTWFRIDNTVAESESLHGLEPEERWIWVCLLAQASKKSCSFVRLNISYLAHRSGSTNKRVIGAIEKLLKNQTVRITEDARTDTNVHERTRTDLALTDRQTDKQTDTVHEFNFELLYEKYPRKVGKARGLKLCEKQITTPEEYDALSTAIDRYTSYLKAQGTLDKYVKHFSTFMADWRDWNDPGAGNSELAKGSLPPLKKLDVFAL